MGNLKYVGLKIEPSDYNVVGHYYYFRCFDDIEEDFDQYDTFVSIDGLNLSDIIIDPETCTCNICNHRIKKYCFFQHKVSNEIIISGLDCSSSMMKFSLDTNTLKSKGLLNKRKEDRKNKLDEIY
jgi:hypothetical protein